MNALKRPLIMVAVLVTFVAVVGVAGVKSTSTEPRPTSRVGAVPTSTPSSPDAAAITDVIVNSYSVRARALQTFDLSQYSTVFVDEVSVPLTSEQAEVVSRVRARYGNATQAMSGNGWLSYSAAFVLDRQKSTEALNNVQAVARAQGRPLTADELRSAFDVNGQPPAPLVYNSGRKQEINVIKATVTGNRAEVEYETGVGVYSTTLIKTASGWRVAGERTLKIHF